MVSWQGELAPMTNVRSYHPVGKVEINWFEEQKLMASTKGKINIWPLQNFHFAFLRSRKMS